MTLNKIPKGPSAEKARKLIFENPQSGWNDLVHEYGKSFIFQRNLATCDPELSNTLLMSRVHTVKRSSVYKFMSKIVPGAPGILFMDGEEWNRQLHAVMPVFTKANIDTYTQVMHEIASTCTTKWNDGERMEDLYEEVIQVGIRVVLRVGYGLNPDDPLCAEFGRELILYKKQTMDSEARFDTFGFTLGQFKLFPKFFKVRSELKVRMKKIQDLVERIIKEKKYLEYGEQNWFNLLVKSNMPIKAITDELNHIYGAFNAIDYAITCGLVELNKNPEIAEKIREEFKQVLGQKQYPSREDFERLPYTTNFMKEVYRYYPVAIAVMRRTGEDLSINGALYPKDREVFILLQAMHHHPDYWENPSAFNPDRWNQPLKEPKAYIPFLNGPRQCIGRHLAELHFVVTLHAILSNCRIKIESSNVAITPYLIPRFAEKMQAVVLTGSKEVVEH